MTHPILLKLGLRHENTHGMLRWWSLRFGPQTYQVVRYALGDDRPLLDLDLQVDNELVRSQRVLVQREGKYF